MTRTLLYEVAQTMMTHSLKWSWLRAWAVNEAGRRGMRKAVVALALRLAVIKHRMWMEGTEVRWQRASAVSA